MCGDLLDLRRCERARASRENIDRILPKLDGMIGQGLVTLERVAVIRYEPKGKGGGH